MPAPSESPSADSEPAPGAPVKHRRKVPGWLELPLTVVLALLLALFVKTFLVQVFWIPSGSMEQTLMVGDRVAVNRLAYHIGEPRRGDVVVFDGAGTFVSEPLEAGGNPVTGFFRELGRTVGLVPPPDTVFVKRLIGVAGDRVQCCDAQGRLLVNGVPIEEPYIYPGDSPSDQPFDVIVPEGSMWLMGDHRAASADSRAHLGDPGGGMVPVDRALGRVTYVVWPLTDAHRVASVSSLPPQ